MIALVPDPALNHHSTNYNAVLEGLEEAFAAEENLSADRKWLPWGDDPSCAESTPGVLIFRPNNPQEAPPRVVLVVGETPTWGVRRGQLDTALNQLPDGAQAVKVLGPTFSGTAPSLFAKLHEKEKMTFELVSGTATSPSLERLFAPPAMKFSATLPNDDQLLRAMLEYLRVRGGDGGRGRIAILSEAGTAYGSNVSADKAGQDDAKQKLIELRFPVDLDPLRRAVAAAPAVSASVAPSPSTPEDLQLLELDEVARELSDHGVRFVGVVASDPEDVISLTERLRSKIPDARFFTLGGDLQLVDPRLNGTLVAHAAPPDAIDYSVYNKEVTRSISLKSEVARNVYLAGRKLLGHPPPDPAVRISLIGNGSLWEIGDAKPARNTPRSYWTVLFFCSVVLFAALVVVLWPWLSKRFPGVVLLTLSRNRSRLSLSLAACARPDLAADDALVNAALLSVVSGAVLLMFVGMYAQDDRVWCCFATEAALVASWNQVIRRAICHRLGGVTQSALVCSLFATAATVFALGTGCSGPHEATLHLLSGGSGVLAGLIGFGMLAVGLWCWRLRLRFLDTHRFGACKNAAQPPLAQAFGETANDGNGLFGAEKCLLAVIHSPWSSLPVVPITVHVLLVVSVALVYLVRPPAAFEPGLRNGLVIGFGLLSLLPITVNFSRIVTTWIALNRVLKHLALFPILKPLRKLPKKLARNLEQQLTAPHADLTELAPLIELLKEIAKGWSAIEPEAEKAERAWLAALRQEMSDHALPAPELSPGELVNLLLDVSARLSPEIKQRDRFRALLVAVFVPRYVRHFRLFIAPVLIGSVLGVLMTSLYFLQPQRLISTVIAVWVTGMVTVAFVIYSALDRTAVISAIGNTTEGSVDFDWTVVSRFISWGIVPLISLFAAQNSSFPSWISTAANALSKALR